MDKVIAFVYSEGRVFNGNQGVIFEGQARPMHLKCNITFDRLKRKIHEKLKLQRNQIISRVICRFMTNSNPIFFSPLELVDTQDVNFMMDGFRQQSFMTTLELYVDIAEAGSSSIPASTNPISAQQAFAHEAGGSCGVEEAVHLGDDTVNLDDDYDYHDTDNVDGEEILSLDDHDEDERLGHRGDSSDSDEGGSDGNPGPPIGLPTPVNVSPETYGVPTSFWNESPHYSYINWEHPDEETDFYAGGDDQTSWQLEMVRTQPTVPVSLIQERITGVLRYKVSYFKAWKAKHRAVAQIFGDWEESYDLLPRWLNYMLRFSPGSYYAVSTSDIIDCNGSKTFKRVFWTFKQCCDAFEYCRPVIQIDGTWLYGKYSGTLLIATTQDGNNNVLPIAFAIVEGENLSSWSWFLRLIRMKVTQNQGICLISDKHAGIKATVSNPANGWQPPNAYHVYCICHIASNFNRTFKNQKHKLDLINMGDEPCPYLFQRQLRRFRGISPAIRDWIDRIDNQTWSPAMRVGVDMAI
ncbi:uncharacterized protein LOC130743810 [Lotus japonicus]|uniref:uncharacterized protein LOC130743810 n=1 Tax=Lotus japonicus TaxID=34305 RepID=UPI00258D3E4A|nr:uncharacterized protein LOC130743810 [Lotus japonicus]